MWGGQGAGLWEQLKEDEPRYRHPQNLNTDFLNKSLVGNTVTNTGTFMVHPSSISYNMSDAISFTN